MNLKKVYIIIAIKVSTFTCDTKAPKNLQENTKCPSLISVIMILTPRYMNVAIRFWWWTFCMPYIYSWPTWKESGSIMSRTTSQWKNVSYLFCYVDHPHCMHQPSHLQSTRSSKVIKAEEGQSCAQCNAVCMQNSVISTHTPHSGWLFF